MVNTLITTRAQIDELQHIATHQHERSSSPSVPPFDGHAKNVLIAHSLVRMGYVSREQYSEHVQGETRFYWWAFKLTKRGRDYLADLKRISDNAKP